MYYTKKIPAVSQNRSKELTIEFEGEFNCLGDMKKKYKNYILKITIYYTARFMASSLSNLVDDLAEGIHKDKCNNKHDNENCETYLIKYKDYESFLEYTSVKDGLIRYKCLCCNNNYQKSLMKT